MADAGGGLGDDPLAAVEALEAGHRGVAHHRPDLHRPVGPADDRSQPRHPAQADEGLGLDQIGVHHGDEGRASREAAGRRVGRQGGDNLFHRLRLDEPHWLLSPVLYR